MKQKTYVLICSAIFFVVAAVHLSRLLWGWDVLLGGWFVPHWLSIPGLVIPGALSGWGLTLVSRTRTNS